jgi:hypothetical protein
MSVTDLSREYEHGEPGGPGGAPIPRQFLSCPVHFSQTHPLTNDPEATPFLDPYTGNPNDPIFPGSQYWDWGQY